MQELLYDYGFHYWSPVRLHMKFVQMIKDLERVRFWIGWHSCMPNLPRCGALE